MAADYATLIKLISKRELQSLSALGDEQDLVELFNSSRDVFPGCVECAASVGDTEILQWLYDLRLGQPQTESLWILAAQTAAKHGHREAVDWILQSGSLRGAADSEWVFLEILSEALSGSQEELFRHFLADDRFQTDLAGNNFLLVKYAILRGFDETAKDILRHPKRLSPLTQDDNDLIRYLSNRKESPFLNWLIRESGYLQEFLDDAVPQEWRKQLPDDLQKYITDYLDFRKKLFQEALQRCQTYFASATCRAAVDSGLLKIDLSEFEALILSPTAKSLERSRTL